MFRLNKLIKSFGSIQNLTDWEKDVIKASKPIIVDFYATWCGPCKRLTPILEQKVKEHPNVTLIKIDIDQHEQLANLNNIEVVPTVILFQNGKKVNNFTGMLPPDQLNKFFDQIPKQ
ncbi:unnamed protein product [Paramecium primaurelia]|uniref:Thioredoxin n=2 Tax=Paramecium TaxID=5884 RepID=A0A8S1S2C1_9CILI|nr:unnamed protein product [Paramecium primaurelia]CAD8133713.1 unnamed protein product [Paramecium pentaurelia]